MIQMTTLIWARWARIALGHLRAGTDALNRLQTEKDLSKWASPDVEVDIEAGMQAITSAVFAVEALSKRLEQLLASASPKPDLKGGGGDYARAMRIIAASTVSPPTSLKSDLKWLYKQRVALVHFKDETSKRPRPHPVLPTNVSAEHAQFSTAHAKRALQILFDCMHACVNAPVPATASWAESSEAVLGQLEAGAAALGL